MDKDTIDLIMSTYGNRLVTIKFDNSQVLHLNYKESVKSADITTTTIGDTDFICVPHVDGMGNRYQALHDTSNVILFITSDTEDGYVDPWILR